MDRDRLALTRLARVLFYALPLAFLAGSVVKLDERLAPLPTWAGLVALTILASYPYLAPEFTEIDPGPEPVGLFQPVGAEGPQIVLLDYEVAPPPTDVGILDSAAPGEKTTHVVQSGETVYSIARQYGVSPQAIIDANNLANPDLLSVGDTLIIPAAE